MILTCITAPAHPTRLMLLCIRLVCVGVNDFLKDVGENVVLDNCFAENGVVGLGVAVIGVAVTGVAVTGVDGNDALTLNIFIFSFRGSFRGDANFYGKGAIQFYTQIKTVTSQWKAEDATPTGSATNMPVMQ